MLFITDYIQLLLGRLAWLKGFCHFLMESYSKIYGLINPNSSVFYIYFGHSLHNCKDSPSSCVQLYTLQPFSSLILNSAYHHDKGRCGGITLKGLLVSALDVFERPAARTDRFVLQQPILVRWSLEPVWTRPSLVTWRLTYLLTPWSRVLLEKLTGSAASQEIPRNL